MREKLRRVWRHVTDNIGLPELFTFGGLGCAAYGLAQIHEPSAWVVVGVALFWLGLRD
jgi:hypothetical protein